MAVLVPRKVISGAVIPNPYGPREDRLVGAYAFTEGSGTTFDNTGFSTFTQWPGFDDPATRAGAINWQNGGHNDPSVDCNNTGHIPIFTTAQAYTFPYGTFAARFRIATGEAFDQYLFHDGAAGLPAGSMQIRRSVGPPTELVCLIGGNSTSWALDAADWNDWHTLVFRWSPNGYRVWLDTYDNVKDRPNFTAAWAPGNGQTFRLGGDGVNHSHLEISAAGFWDLPLQDKEVYDLLDDPWLPWRLLPNKSNEFATQSGPLVGRMTTTSVLVRAVSGYGASQSGYGTKISISYGTTRALGSTAISAAVSTPRTSIDLEVTGLSPGTRYYYRPLWSMDNGATWQPFPRGLSEFCTQGANGSFVVFADDHTLAAFRPADDPDSFGVITFKGTKNRKQYSAWCLARDVWLNTSPNFIVCLGDSYYCDRFTDAGTADFNQEHFEQCADWIDVFFYLWKTGGLFFVPGNHEGEQGYRQHGTPQADVALQKQATVARKIFFPNPDDSTYPEGGENEGDPNVDGDLSWLPSAAEQARTKYTDYAGGYAGYLADYVVDGFSPRLNTSPLGNYYAFTWGDALFAMIDVNRYTEPGDPLVDTVGTCAGVNRPVDQWTLGPIQDQWLRNTLYGTSAPWKFVFAHHVLGCEQMSSGGTGGYYYGFGSGARTNGRTHQLLRNARATAFVMGHNHKCAHVVRQGVNYINVPSNTVAQGVGRHTELFNDSFGTAASEGAELHDGEDAALIGIRNHYSIAGYLLFSFSSSACSFVVRQTCLCYTVNGSMEETRDFDKERFLGPVRAAGEGALSANVVDVEEAPRDVAYAAKEADLTGDWWSSPPTDYKGAAVGDYGFDEDYADGEVTLDVAIDGDDVRVDHIPRTLDYNPTLANAEPARGQTIEAEPEDNMVAPTYEMQVGVEGV